MFNTKLQQGNKTLSIGNGITMANLYGCTKTFRKIDKGCGWTSMQSRFIHDHSIKKMSVIASINRRLGSDRTLTGQGFNNITRISGMYQAIHLLFIAQHTSKPSQD